MVIKRFIFSFVLVFAFTAISGFGQNAPYSVGESMEYEGSYSKLVLRGIDVALLKFKVDKSEKSNDLVIKTEAISNGGIVKLFNFKFYQRFESFVDGSTFDVLKTVKRDEQGDRIRDSEAVFDYKSKKVIYVETNPKDLSRPPHTVASPIETTTHDLVTGIYQLRHMKLEVGKSFDITVSDSGLIYKVPVNVTAREQKKSILGKKWCFRVEPQVFGENRLIERDGDMTIWITDDKSRIPIRSTINTSIGKIVVKLKKISYGNDRKPAAK
jgi:Protein of unknown function (DUF3108)